MKYASFIDKLASGQPVVGTFFELGSTTAAECLGISDLDFFVIDTEHGPFSTESALSFIHAAQSKNIAPFVRVQDESRSSILKMLDVGACALIIPCIETVEQAKQIVTHGKFAPVGNRGFFLGRTLEFGKNASASDFGNYFQQTNENTLLIPQCETQNCLAVIEEIAALDGIDGIFIGPYDLSIGLGIPGQFDSPSFSAAVNRVICACNDAKKPCFSYGANPSAAREYLALGCAGVAVGTDTSVYIEAYQKIKEETLVR